MLSDQFGKRHLILVDIRREVCVLEERIANLQKQGSLANDTEMNVK